MIMRRFTPALLLLLFGLTTLVSAEPNMIQLKGEAGPGKGKHIVLISGDEEYRSEEALPMLAHILSRHHGFDCTVLFSINPEDGTIDPTNQTNIPGFEHLKSADLCILFTRFREIPDDQMKHFVEYLESGKPIIGIRTATHAFHYSRDTDSPYANYGWQSKDWKGGFGQQVLGETWINHHGRHKKESTRGVIVPEQADHPILRGVDDIWGPTDVYGVVNLTDDAKVLMRGQVLEGMKPDDQPVAGEKNAPMMPLVWLKPYQVEGGQWGRAFTTTFGSAIDFQSEDGRRLIVNAAFFLLGLEDAIKSDLNVETVGEYDPSFYGFGEYRKGKKPSDYLVD